MPVSREIVAQFEVRKALILLDNPGFGRPYFEPGGRRFESVRARLFIKGDAEISIACAIQSVIAIGPHESFAPELPEFPVQQLVILTSADRAARGHRLCY